jgi:FkbM family methyltransferase
VSSAARDDVPRRRRARAALAEAVQRGLRRLGYELHAYPPPVPVDPEDDRRARLLRTRGITLVLDVGANEGQYAQRVRAAGYRGRIVSFEPLAEAFARLERNAAADPAWEARRLALGDRDGEARLNVAANTTSSSLLPMRERHVRSAPQSAYVGTATVPAARLDSIWDTVARLGERAWLKLDVQGYEPAVLDGAEVALGGVDVVQAELALVPLYEGDVPWRQLVDRLADRGFRLAGLEAGFEDPDTGELLQADGIFVRDRPAGGGG